MAHSSPIFAAPDAGAGSPSRVNAHAPSITVPLSFVMTGVLALFAGVAWLVARPEVLASYHYNQYAIAITHLFTLGWVTSVIMGAMYQLVPVALETRLYSERLARWHYVLHVAGLAGMIWAFWTWKVPMIGSFGCLLGAGIILFVINLSRTLARVPRWNVVAAAIASSLFWLLLVMLAGLYLTATKLWPINSFSPLAQMHAHAHLGGIGVFVLMIVGVSYKLVPMFLLSEVRNVRRAAWSIRILNGSLLGLVVAMALASPWKTVFAAALVGGLALYGIELRAIIRARKRRQLDWALRYFVTAILLLVPTALLGLILSWPALPLTRLTGQLETVYGVLGLLGVVTLAILGMLYKIVPFLVWMHSYSGAIGRHKVPALAEMYSPNLQAATYWLYLAGLAAVCAATLSGQEGAVRGSCAILAASLVPLGANFARIAFHFVHPIMKPLVFAPAASPLP